MVERMDMQLQQNIWPHYGFKVNPYDTMALTTQVESFLPISLAIVGRGFSSPESKAITNFLRSAGGGRIMCEGDIGIGKTTFANYHRYLWEQEAKDRLFTPISEIPIQHHWSIREFLLTVLSSLINKLLLVLGERRLKKDPIFREILAVSRVFFTSSYQFGGQAWGFGLGVEKNQQINVPYVSESQLLFYFQEAVKTIVNQGYSGVLLHFDNLELLNQSSIEKTKALFQDIRDALQIPNVFYIFVSQKGFFSEIIGPLERMRSIFHGLPVYIPPLTIDQVLEAIHKRYQLLSLRESRYIIPVADSFIQYLYQLYEGKIRFVVDSLSQLILTYHSGATQTIDSKTAYQLLERLVKERMKQFLSPKEQEIIWFVSQLEIFSQKDIIDKFQIKRPNVVSYLNNLLVANCIYRHSREGKNVFYRAHDVFRILQNPYKDSQLPVGKIQQSDKPDEYLRYNQRQRKMIDFIKCRKFVTAKEYAKEAEVSPATARSDLKLFIDKRLVVKLGKTRSSEYHWQGDSS